MPHSCSARLPSPQTRNPHEKTCPDRLEMYSPTHQRSRELDNSDSTRKRPGEVEDLDLPALKRSRRLDNSDSTIKTSSGFEASNLTSKSTEKIEDLNLSTPERLREPDNLNPTPKRPREVEDLDLPTPKRVRGSDNLDATPRQSGGLEDLKVTPERSSELENLNPTQGSREAEGPDLPTPNSSARSKNPDATSRIPRERKVIDPIQHWALHGSWPSNFHEMNSDKSESSGSQKRRRSSSGYTADARAGKVPAAHTAKTETLLAAHKVILAYEKGREHVSPRSREMCQNMLAGSHGEVSPCIGYPIAELETVLARLRVRNEAMVVRDLTPLLVPSAQNLTLSGSSELSILAEDINADWKNIKTMGGPCPRPDLTIGLDTSAFTPAERNKLDMCKTWERPTSFTDHVLFPFLVCEVKGSEQNVNKAGRQASHGAAIATNAIWQLCHSARQESPPSLNEDQCSGDHIDPRAGVRSENPINAQVENQGEDSIDSLARPSGGHIDSRPSSSVAEDTAAAAELQEKLNGEILVFSVVHDTTMVELYGHFPIWNDGGSQPTIYRHLIKSYALAGDAEKIAREIRNFVLSIYRDFSTTHLQRIRDALGMMPEPQLARSSVPTDAGQDAGWAMGPPSLSASQMREKALERQLEEKERSLERQLEEMRSASQMREKALERRLEEKERSLEEERKQMQAQISQLITMVGQLTKSSGT